MIVERRGLYDFKVIMTEQEFTTLKLIAETGHLDIAFCLSLGIKDLLDIERENEPKGINLWS